MKEQISILSGKLVQKIAKLKGGGSALPGIFMEKTNPNFVQKTLSKLPHGVVVISGTNGKTTTTKMVAELLESQNLRVFTNKTGSNFVRGVAAALLEKVDLFGNLPADIAVLELDEAHATHFVAQSKPRYSLLLNVMRDQLDRFGEIDHTAKLLQKLGQATSGIVVLNGADSLLGAEEFSKEFSKVVRFGAGENLAEFFPRDEELHSKNEKNSVRISYSDISVAQRSEAREQKLQQKILSVENSERKERRGDFLNEERFDFLLEEFSKNSAQIRMSGDSKIFKLQISGTHNILNLTAAIALTREILNAENLKFNKKTFEKAIFEIKPAFGRGEIINLNGQEIEIMLVKNPAGFRSNLKSSDLENAKVMIAINDNYADGRDMSWLWDVDFSPLLNSQISTISGVRAFDMAVRLFHDDVEFDEEKIQPEIKKAVQEFLAESGEKKKIFATYTAMLEIRKQISKLTDVEKIL